MPCEPVTNVLSRLLLAVGLPLVFSEEHSDRNGFDLFPEEINLHTCLLGQTGDNSLCYVLGKHQKKRVTLFEENDHRLILEY